MKSQFVSMGLSIHDSILGLLPYFKQYRSILQPSRVETRAGRSCNISDLQSVVVAVIAIVIIIFLISISFTQKYVNYNTLTIIHTRLG